MVKVGIQLAWRPEVKREAISEPAGIEGIRVGSNRMSVTDWRPGLPDDVSGGEYPGSTAKLFWCETGVLAKGRSACYLRFLFA